MSQTDPIAELLTRVRNAAHARHNELELSHSRIREAIARVLVAEGFLESAEVAGEGHQKTIKIRVRYAPSGRAVMEGIERVSRPSIRSMLAVFILQLHSDHRAAVLPHQTFQLFADLPIKRLDI